VENISVYIISIYFKHIEISRGEFYEKRKEKRENRKDGRIE
jgi:hypothetical protein